MSTIFKCIECGKDKNTDVGFITRCRYLGDTRNKINKDYIGEEIGKVCLPCYEEEIKSKL